MTSKRTPLIADTMPEDTASARRLGAQILGRALAHATAIAEEHGGEPSSWYCPGCTAMHLGYDGGDIRAACAAYDELLGT